LESIDEEQSDERNNEQEANLSMHTSDPRYFANTEYMNALQKAASVADNQPRYSIMVKRISSQDLLDQEKIRMKKIRSSKAQPTQNNLQLRQRVSSKSIVAVTVFSL
jgi:hypothetical protein